MRKIQFVTVAVFGLLLWGGCSALTQQSVAHVPMVQIGPVVDLATGQTNEVAQTNMIEVPVVTVAAGVTKSIAAIRSINALSSPVNPYAGIVDWVMGLGLAGLTWYARTKSAQAQLHLNVAQTMAQGIENVPPEVSGAVKSAIADLAGKKNIYATLDNIVQAVSKK